MYPTEEKAYEYAKEHCLIKEWDKVVDTQWLSDMLKLIIITKTHLAYQLVIAYDFIDGEYYVLESRSGYMHVSEFD